MSKLPILGYKKHLDVCETENLIRLLKASPRRTQKPIYMSNKFTRLGIISKFLLKNDCFWILEDIDG